MRRERPRAAPQNRTRREQPRVEAERRAGLVNTIEGEIIPRLLMSVAALNRGGVSFNANQPTAEAGDVMELARLLLAHEPAVAAAFVEIIRQRGTPPERICVDLLAPTARRLGELWEQDACDFAQLTAGLRRLQSLLRQVGTAAGGCG
jgi:hypothetical protein